MGAGSFLTSSTIGARSRSGARSDCTNAPVHRSDRQTLAHENEPQRMSLLSAHGIEKSYGPHRVLAGVAATVASGEHIGLVGNNGSGKTTLARVIGKLEPPDVGTVMQQKGSRIGYL